MTKVYLGLGDSMSIDFYTNIDGGGAIAQFSRFLGENWEVVDKSFDGCRMREVPTDLHGDIITLTIGGNDLLANQEIYLADDLESFKREHLALLRAIRANNAKACFIIGNIYAPDAPLKDWQLKALDRANELIVENVRGVRAELADIHGKFRGHGADYLVMGIEPNYRGATAIAELLQKAYEKATC